MVTLTRQHHQAQYFIEPLGEGAELEMTLIPAGTFVMGSPADELERRDSEGPQHEVMVPSFCMGTYPVTQAQWRLVAELSQVETTLAPDPARCKEALHPVERVTWYEAVEFCARLAQHTGRPYRLPSEAEWEYACRAGTTAPFHFGETITTEIANYRGQDREISGRTYNGSYGAGPLGKFRQKTTPVNHFKIANAFGLCDVHGNVSEWCQDAWHDNYEGAPSNGSAWSAGGNQGRRVLRGGSWADFPRYCRSACREFYDPGARYGNNGFRVVCSAPNDEDTSPIQQSQRPPHLHEILNDKNRTLLNLYAITLDPITPGQLGHVLFQGAQWRACCDRPQTIAKGETVQVIDRQANILKVIPY
jgi:formylglycine-generating enzyme required for sulfatase activity